MAVLLIVLAVIAAVLLSAWSQREPSERPKKEPQPQSTDGRIEGIGLWAILGMSLLFLLLLLGWAASS